MLSAKEAAQRAMVYLNDLVPGASAPLVEEVSLAAGNWLITISYNPPAGTGSFLLGVGREYKAFDIDGETGQVVSMKIRSVPRG